MTEQNQMYDITYALAASPGFSNDGICFAARGSGLYRSDDRGDTWHFAYGALNLEAPLPTLAVVVSPDFESDRAVFAGAPGGILRSFDGGNSWLITTLPSPPPVVSTLVISPNYSRDSVLLAGTTEDGVFRSGDGGSHWVAWNFGLLDLNVLCMAISPDFANDETLFVGTETGIFRSTNGGRAWREADFSPDLAPVLSLALSPDYAADNTLYAGTEAHGLYYSQDRGRSWMHLGEDVIDDSVNGIILASEFPSQADVLVALTDRLLYSRDGGNVWSVWKKDLAFEQGIASVIAPKGLGPDAPLLVGLTEGDTLRI
jgi:photosystem II stability/assembly factor-like uncharacterized protein